MRSLLISHPDGLLEAIIGKCVAIIDDALICNGSVVVKTEAMKLLQDLSIIAASGYEGVFKKVVDCIVVGILPKQEQHFFVQANSETLTQILVLKEHAVLTLGNLIFDSQTLYTAAVSHRHVAGPGESNQISVSKQLLDLIHFKRSQLTYACLWTLNNLMNY